MRSSRTALVGLVCVMGCSREDRSRCAIDGGARLHVWMDPAGESSFAVSVRAYCATDHQLVLSATDGRFCGLVPTPVDAGAADPDAGVTGSTCAANARFPITSDAFSIVSAVTRDEEGSVPLVVASIVDANGAVIVTAHADGALPRPDAMPTDAGTIDGAAAGDAGPIDAQGAIDAIDAMP